LDEEARFVSRPIGVTLLAAGAGLAGLFQLWRMGVFLGIFNWTFIGQEVSFNEAQWGQALWALILAAIWFWVAAGFWGVRAYAWSFGVFISLFTLIWGFFAVLFGSSIEQETVPWLLAGIIYLYLQYPGVRQHFEKSELDRLTPEQRAAYEQLMAANAAAAQARVAPAPAPQAPAPAPQPPAAPSDTNAPGA
jgi:hypothetical protein